MKSVIVNEDLVAVKEPKEQLTQNKPIYYGFTILQLSNILMFDFHYNYSSVSVIVFYTYTDTIITHYHVFDDLYAC